MLELHPQANLNLPQVGPLPGDHAKRRRGKKAVDGSANSTRLSALIMSKEKATPPSFGDRSSLSNRSVLAVFSAPGSARGIAAGCDQRERRVLNYGVGGVGHGTGHHTRRRCLGRQERGRSHRRHAYGQPFLAYVIRYPGIHLNLLIAIPGHYSREYRLSDVKSADTAIPVTAIFPQCACI